MMFRNARLMFCVVLVLCLGLLYLKPLHADALPTVPPYFRVLLCDPSSGLTSLSFDSSLGIQVWNGSAMLWESPGQGITVESISGQFWTHQAEYTKYSDAYAEGNRLWGSSVPWQAAYYHGSWQVWVGSAHASSLNEATIRAANPSIALVSVPLSIPVLLLDTLNGDSWIYAEHVDVASSPQRALKLQGFAGEAVQVAVKGHSYAGFLEIYVDSSGGLMLVNEVDIESYVGGSLAIEMSPSWPIEALKAQAVAIRTMALWRYMAANPEQLYTLSDRELSYSGVERMQQGRVWEAVQATAGQLVLHDNAPIQATFHADSGGHTQNSEDVWFAALPYLRGVPELFSSEGPDAAWPAQPALSGQELAEMLQKAGRGNIGTVLRIITEEQTPFGAAVRLRFEGTNGDIVLEMGAIREVLQVKSNNVWLSSARYIVAKGASSSSVPTFPGAYARSGQSANAVALQDLPLVRSASTVAMLAPSTAREGFSFSGAGWGHGVGLSQWGAKAMADHGYDYQSILTHYYTGVTITP